VDVLAGMQFCSGVEGSSPNLSFIMLLCVVLEWPWVRDYIAYGDRDVCVSRMVGYASQI